MTYFKAIMTKKHLFLPLSIAALSLMGAVSCNSSDKAGNTTVSESFTVDSVRVADSIVIDSSKAACYFNVAYPSGHGALSDSVRCWIANQLAYIYASDKGAGAAVFSGLKGNVPAMVRLTVDSLLSASGREIEEGMVGFGGYEYNCSLLEEHSAPGYVTFGCTYYYYGGGAHGVSRYEPATFSVADGRRLTWDNTIGKDSRKAVLALIRQELFKPHDGYSLADDLLIDPDSLDLPAAPPAFVEGGLQVIYGQYEIAPYAAGMPGCILPVDSVLPLLTPEAKALLGRKQQ